MRSVSAINAGEALVNGEEVRIAGVRTFGTRSRPTRTGRTPGPARRFRHRRRCHRLLRQKRHSGMRLTPAGGRGRGLAADSDLERHAYTRCGNQPITIR